MCYLQVSPLYSHNCSSKLASNRKRANYSLSESMSWMPASDVNPNPSQMNVSWYGESVTIVSTIVACLCGFSKTIGVHCVNKIGMFKGLGSDSQVITPIRILIMM